MAFNLFIALDLTLLAVILVILSILLYKNRNKLGKEGPFFLYRTKWGINLIEKIGGKYKKTLKALTYVSITLGYFLMAGIIYLFGNSVWQYLTSSAILETTGKAPPLAPILPYFPQLFGWGDIFPMFYFIYFLLAISIVMFVHEFSHGIFARRWGIKIKSTGFVFLKYFPLIYGAFVEQDDKQLEKATKFQQMSVLSAGVFANVVVGIIFFFLMVGFFNIAYAPSGAVFQDYSYIIIPTATITGIGNVTFNSPPTQESVYSVLNQTPTAEIKALNKTFPRIKSLIEENEDYIAVYDNKPAINANLRGIVVQINDIEINTDEEFREVLSEFSPGEEITIKTIFTDGNESTYQIKLAEHPEDSEKAFLGIMGFQEQNSITEDTVHFLSSFRKTNLRLKSGTYYTPTLGEFSEFGYYLLFWIVLINILVALFNMLPLSFLDGGRFFYLTIWGITRNEKVAERLFKGVGYFILLLLIALMVRWVFILAM